jgi:hypothetical protein
MLSTWHTPLKSSFGTIRIFVICGVQHRYILCTFSETTSCEKYSEVEIKKMLGFLIDNILFCRCWWSCLPTVCWNSHGYELCLSVSGSISMIRRNSFKNFYMRRKNLLLWSSIRHFDISTMFYLLTTINFTHASIRISQWVGNQRHHRMLHICFVFRYIIEIGY